MKSLLAPATFFRSNARRASRLCQELIVDNFAGGGGASLGIELATGRAVDISINHDPDAVEMHGVNHPASKHLCESVWKVDPRAVTRGRPIGLAWFSPDCRHFSRAKGGKPVKKNVRGLAWIVVKWAKLVKPRLIILENVREFQDWGPLTADSMPCPDRKGQTFRRWWRQLEILGYVVERKVLDAADYGAPTHRKRLFVIARCDGSPIVWPAPTHGKGRKRYRTAAECIDWTIPCPSIFDRKRPLAEKTLRRIAMGLKRYVIDAANPFIVQVNHGGEEFRGQDVDRPLSTVSAKHGFGVVTPYIARCAHGDDCNGGKARWGKGEHPINEPLPTMTGSKDFAVVTPTLIQTGFGERDGQAPRALDLQKPLGTVVGTQKHALVSAFLNKFRFDSDGAPVDVPLPTITAGGNAGGRPAGAAHAMGVTAANLIGFHCGNGPQWASVEQPLGTITGQGLKFGLVYAFLMKFFGSGGQWQGADAPLHTITGKDRFGLVQVEVSPGRMEPAVAIDVPGIGPCIIADIGMRMLSPRELLAAQFSPELAKDYILTGSKANQVHKIGNSVCPLVAKAIVAANYAQAESEVAA